MCEANVAKSQAMAMAMAWLQQIFNSARDSGYRAPLLTVISLFLTYQTCCRRDAASRRQGERRFFWQHGFVLMLVMKSIAAGSIADTSTAPLLTAGVACEKRHLATHNPLCLLASTYLESLYPADGSPSSCRPLPTCVLMLTLMQPCAAPAGCVRHLNLHEYQSKDLMEKFGVTVQRGKTCEPGKIRLYVPMDSNAIDEVGPFTVTVLDELLKANPALHVTMDCAKSWPRKVRKELVHRFQHAIGRVVSVPLYRETYRFVTANPDLFAGRDTPIDIAALQTIAAADIRASRVFSQ